MWQVSYDDRMWTKVPESRVVLMLGKCYESWTVPRLMDDAKQGIRARTTWAIYRWVEKEG